LWYESGGVAYYYAPDSVFDYGVLSATTNWFGIPISTAASIVANTTAVVATGVQTSIQLAAGTNKQTVVKAPVKIL
jgi:hypothetical protein